MEGEGVEIGDKLATVTLVTSSLFLKKIIFEFFKVFILFRMNLTKTKSSEYRDSI